MESWWEANKAIVIPILVFVGVIYWAALRTAWSNIWKVKEDPFWWKVRSSLMAVFTCVVPAAVEMWHKYGEVILKLVLSLFGIVTAAKGIKAHMTYKKLQNSK